MPVAGALISGSSGGVIRVSAAPPSVALNAYENRTSAVAFDERREFTLLAPVTVNAIAPGTYTAFTTNVGTIPAGTVVDTSLIHSDPPSGSFTVRRTGSVTFADDILGVIASTQKLAASDNLGAQGTTYAGSTGARGLEGAEDKFTISADHRTVSFSVATGAVMDELRVITQYSNHLSTSISDSPDPVQTGDPVTYSVTVTNNGPSTAPDVHVADNFPGATLVTATSSGGCTGPGPVTCALGPIASGASATALVTVSSPSTVPSGGVLVNTASSPPGENPVATESTTVVSPVLDTTISDSPDPVTAGNDVQYTLTVTNHGAAAVADVHVLDTLPFGTTFVSSSAPNGCVGTSPVDCSLGGLGVGGFAVAHVIVASPALVPDSGTITDSAVASPGTNTTTNETTTVEESPPGVSKGFVPPGGSITSPGDNPATVTLPNTGDGAPILITQDDGTFCDGPCSGPATTVSDFPGYNDPNHPIRLTLTYTFPASLTSLTDAASAFGSSVYKNDDPLHPTVGTVVPFCTSPGAGVAVPHPCIDAHTITQPTFNSFVVTFQILYLSGDPRFGRR